MKLGCAMAAIRLLQFGAGLGLVVLPAVADLGLLDRLVSFVAMSAFCGRAAVCGHGRGKRVMQIAGGSWLR